MFEAVPLGFARDAIVPQISPETFDYHYDKHYLGYLKKVNAAIVDSGRTGSLEDLIRGAHADGEDAFANNAAQVWNHAFFWQSIAAATDQVPHHDLRVAIERQFGGFDAFVEAFVSVGTAHFGSGWAWLALRGTSELIVEATHDAQPIWLGSELHPLLICDLWEHAYYIDWRNDRAGFLRAYITKRANWEHASHQFSAVTEHRAAWTYPAQAKVADPVQN